ncbi:MAG: adenylyl-sulfate reductase subunit alpha [Bacillota bacterium]
MAVPNFETVEVKCDVLICGAGMAGCGAMFEASYWAKKNGLKVVVADKAATDRSGAVAQGLSAINMYMNTAGGERTPADFARMVRMDMMGVSREDLTFDIARHVDSSVHLFEKWGLPIWRDADGKPIRSGAWQVMISGESYKILVAEASKKALADAGGELYERVFIIEPLMDGDRIAGAIGFSTRENKIYVFNAKAVLANMGGAVHVFRPRSTGEGLGRTWYPPFQTGSSTYFTLRAGAEQTCQEIRFVPVRFKDAYGPVGAWFLLFKSTATNALDEIYVETRKKDLEPWQPYASAKPLPANLRNYQGILDEIEGKGPLLMRTERAIAALAEKYAGDEKAYKKKMKELESEAWEDFLDMTIGQANLWAAMNVRPEQVPSEITGAEPYFIGSHSGASGTWANGPTDIAPPEYNWSGYNRMTTVKGLFVAGDACGASAHKFSSGSFTEGRIAGKSMVRFVVENPDMPKLDSAQVEEFKARIIRPFELFEQHKDYGTTPEVNPNYIIPRQYLFRLQKIMDEYAGGWSCAFTTNKTKLEIALKLLDWLKEDGEKMIARDLHELMRVFENQQRTWQAEAHVRTILFREESRWPGYYHRTDTPAMDDANWKCFVNLKWDKANGWQMFKKPVIQVVG